MVDMRRRGPEPPPGPPQIQFKPGIANEMLRALAPLLAEEGIDVDNIDVPDLDNLQAAMNRAVERHNMARFTPVGRARELVVTTLRLVIDAMADGDNALAGSILQQVQPESPDNTVATVAGCIGLTLGLLDDWLTGNDPQAPKNLGQQVRGGFQRTSQQWAYECVDCSCARARAGDFHPRVLRGRLLSSSWTCRRRSAEWTARLVEDVPSSVELR